MSNSNCIFKQFRLYTCTSIKKQSITLKEGSEAAPQKDVEKFVRTVKVYAHIYVQVCFVHTLFLIGGVHY